MDKRSDQFILLDHRKKDHELPLDFESDSSSSSSSSSNEHSEPNVDASSDSENDDESTVKKNLRTPLIETWPF